MECKSSTLLGFSLPGYLVGSLSARHWNVKGLRQSVPPFYKSPPLTSKDCSYSFPGGSGGHFFLFPGGLPSTRIFVAHKLLLFLSRRAWQASSQICESQTIGRIFPHSQAAPTSLQVGSVRVFPGSQKPAPLRNKLSVSAIYKQPFFWDLPQQPSRRN